MIATIQIWMVCISKFLCCQMVKLSENQSFLWHILELSLPMRLNNMTLELNYQCSTWWIYEWAYQFSSTNTAMDLVQTSVIYYNYCHSVVKTHLALPIGWCTSSYSYLLITVGGQYTTPKLGSPTAGQPYIPPDNTPVGGMMFTQPPPTSHTRHSVSSPR